MVEPVGSPCSGMMIIKLFMIISRLTILTLCLKHVMGLTRDSLDSMVSQLGEIDTCPRDAYVISESEWICPGL
jgi:hypothetical protein